MFRLETNTTMCDLEQFRTIGSQNKKNLMFKLELDGMAFFKNGTVFRKIPWYH